MPEPQVSPELAGKVLAAEKRNAIKGVGDGGTLPTPLRKEMQMAALTPELAAQQRAASLLSLFCAGKDLSAAQWEEIRAAHPGFAEIPPPPSATPPPSPPPSGFGSSNEGEKSNTAPGAAPPLHLDPEAPRLTGSRVKYPETLATYAERYGSDERTLKRWVFRGRWQDAAGTQPRVPPDLPPFHRPAELPAWCERCMQNRPPEWVLRVAHEAARAAEPTTPPPLAADPIVAPEPAAPAAAPPAPSIPLPGQLPPRDFSDVRALDFEANVEQLRLSLAIDHRLLDEAKLGQDEALTVKRQRAYRETYDLLRKSESDLIAWKEQVGKLAPFDEVRAENTRIAASIFAAVLRLVRNIRPKLAGKPEPEQDALWKEETLRCFVSLRDARFLDHEAALRAA